MPSARTISILMTGIAVILIGGVMWYFRYIAKMQPEIPSPQITPPSLIMKLESFAFVTNEMIPAEYTCNGADVSPALAIRDVPPGAKSLVLIVDDPDAPAGLWVHWVLWNIAPDIKEIAKGIVPAGAVEGMTSFGRPGYGGPCPPSGTHHYMFKLYALDTTLSLSPSATARDVEEAMQGSIQAEAILIGLYARGR